MLEDLEFAKKREHGSIDHIVIEIMGLPNPTPIIPTFHAKDQVFNVAELDGIMASMMRYFTDL